MSEFKRPAPVADDAEAKRRKQKELQAKIAEIKARVSQQNLGAIPKAAGTQAGLGANIAGGTYLQQQQQKFKQYQQQQIQEQQMQQQKYQQQMFQGQQFQPGGPGILGAPNAAAGAAGTGLLGAPNLSAIQARIAQFKAQQQQQQREQQTPEEKSKPKSFRLNEKGELVDESGEIVQVSSRTPTFKANIRAKQVEETPVEEEPAEEDNEYFDPDLIDTSRQKNKFGLKFIERGKFERMGEKMRHEKQLKKLQAEIELNAKKTGISAATKLALLTPKDSIVSVVPDVEWWDATILPTGSYDCLDKKTEEGDMDMDVDIEFKGITDLIENPEQMAAPIEDKNVQMPVYLTKKERIKIRRQRRREAEIEKREKVAMGIMAPDDPKLKLSNFMRSQTEDAILNPSMVEGKVREQMESRQQAHLLHNESRKLTKEERSQKKTEKLTEDVSQQAYTTVYRLNHIRDPKNRYKVDINSQQFKFTGRVISSPDVALIVVEGGPKNIKKFKKLMMNRIKWENEARDRFEDEDAEHVINKCHLVWEGTVKTPAFTDWRVKMFPQSNEAREHLKRYHVEHYWDLCLTQAINTSGGLEEN